MRATSVGKQGVVQGMLSQNFVLRLLSSKRCKSTLFLIASLAVFSDWVHLRIGGGSANKTNDKSLRNGQQEQPTDVSSQQQGTFSPTPAPGPDMPIGTCGYGNVGNGLCDKADECCSAWGWCGSTDDHCASEDAQGTCGGGERGNGMCPDSEKTRECCSLEGVCGTSFEDCHPTGFCNWGSDGTAETATCERHMGSDWCNQSIKNCEGEDDCGGKWCS